MGHKQHRINFRTFLFPSIHQVCPTQISVLSWKHMATHFGLLGSFRDGCHGHNALARRRCRQHFGKYGCLILHCHVWVSSILLENGDPDKIGKFHSPSLHYCNVPELRILVRSGNLSNEGRQGIYSQCVGVVIWVGASCTKVDLWQWTKSTGE